MEAVSITKSLVGISVVNSASDGVSSGIIPIAEEGIHIKVAVGSAGVVGSKSRISGTTRSIYDAAVSFTRSTTNIISIRRSVGAVNQISGHDGSLSVVDSASKGVEGGIDVEVTLRIERTHLHAFIIIVQVGSSHSRVSIGSGTLGK
jgi:hypothetical protein